MKLTRVTCFIFTDSATISSRMIYIIWSEMHAITIYYLGLQKPKKYAGIVLALFNVYSIDIELMT